jgi:hypothetical protein
MDKINAKVAGMPISTLKEMAVKLFSDQREGTEIVLSAVLNALEARMPEKEFVEFCEGIA